MSYQKTTLTILLGMAAMLFSCKKDLQPENTAAPQVEIKEVGTANSKLVYAGHELHLEMAVAAPGNIASIKLQITYAKTDIAWDFLHTYSQGYTGKKNAVFHEHISVPENAKTGDYELLVIVTDQTGKTSQAKTIFRIARDTSLPSASGINIRLNGNQLSVAAEIAAQNGLAKVEVEVQSSPWTKVFEFREQDLTGQRSYSLNRNLEVSPLLGGHYHVNLYITDQLGKSITYAYHFDK